LPNQLRILAITALTPTLVGCTGDRIKQRMNSARIVRDERQGKARTSNQSGIS